MSSRYAPHLAPSPAHALTPSPSRGRNDARDDLFSTYNRSASPSKSKQKPKSPYGPGGYGYASPASDSSFSAYPGAPSNGSLYPGTSSNGSYGVDATYRAATPNSRGQYSAAVLDELESQNENEHVGILTNKVKQLKDVSSHWSTLLREVANQSGRIVDTPDRGRDSRFDVPRGKDERSV
jgi:blocked-early-in-transport protein 1